MIRLDATTRSITFSLDGSITTNQLEIVSSYSDNNGTTYVGGTTTALSNNASQITIVSAPATSVVRDIDSITVFNNDTVVTGINIFLNDNGSLFQLVGANLQPADTFTWTHAGGWKITDVNGATRTTVYSQVASALASASLLPNGTTAVTQTTGDNSTKVATDQFVQNSFAAYQAAYPPLSNNINQVTVNLGTPSFNGSFNIAITGGVPGTPVMVTQAPTRPNSNLYDNVEMDQITATGIVTSSKNIQVNWGCKTRVCNQYTFNYWI